MDKFPNTHTIKTLMLLFLMVLIVFAGYSTWVPGAKASPDSIYSDVQDGSVSNGGSMTTTEIEVGDTSHLPPGTYRGLVKFSLSSLSGVTLGSVTLYVYVGYSQHDGAPDDYTDPLTNPGLGDCLVRHIDDYGTLSADDYSASSIGNDPGVLIGSTATPNIGYVWIDVTAAVAQDVGSGRSYSAFMIKMATDTDSDSYWDTWRFRSVDDWHGTGYGPYIDYTTTQTLTTNVASGSGFVSPNCPSGCSEVVGSSVTVTATPSPGWQFSAWSTQTGISCSTNPCTFSMPNNAVTLKATFTKFTQTNSYKLWVTVEPTGAGTVKLSPAGTACPTTPAGVTKCAVYTTALLPPNGPTVSFTATPAPGYYFVAWALNGSYLSTGIPANNPDSWVMNASYALTAYFQAQNQWVRYPGNPVLTTSTNSWDSDVVFDSKAFLFPNGTFGMAYFGCCTGYGIGLATSPDGRTWTKVSNAANGGPILLRGSPGQWDYTVVRPGSIFYDSSTSQYLLYYSGRTSNPNPSGKCGIGVAYSTDAITWTKSPANPLINTNAPTCRGLSSPSVIKVGSTYTMWYGEFGAVNIATSSTAYDNWDNGTNGNNGGAPVFTPTCYGYNPPSVPWCYGADPVLAPGQWDSDYVYAPVVVYDPAANNFKMFYSGQDGSGESPFTQYYGALDQTGFATSPDGINWTRYSGNPIIAPVPGGWENGDSTDWPGVLLVNGQLFVYYSGDTFTNQTCLESGSSSVPGTGTCPVSNNPWFGAIPSHFLNYGIGGAYSIQSSSFSGEVVITGDSPINILATDPLGRTVGANATTSINEIPGATYSGPGTEPQKITIPNPVPGAYVVQVFGIGIGPYHMKLQTISDVGSVVGTQDFSGQASIGSNSSFTPGLDPSG
ncbi:MAG: hypothetical protein WB661_07120, partial [Candidatus Bathyarchaeia archaeon]